MRVFLPYHLGSGNRGCEGIARGVSNIFQLSPDELVLFDASKDDYEQDKKLGLGEISELRYKYSLFSEILLQIAKVLNKLGIPFMLKQIKSSLLVKDISSEDYMLMTGGDIYCYEGAQEFPNIIAKKAKAHGAKTVLYGASFEEEYLTDIVVDGLKNFDQIITRETFSSNILKKHGLNNTLLPDPAFSLGIKECVLPDYFNDKKVVGINFSIFTDQSGLFYDNIVNLINYILSEGMIVCLIPHVFWKGQDDRKNLNKIVGLFTENVYVLKSEQYSYLELRYIISKCAFFVGGRTHAVISAYCTHVPCLALGYSIKARGIAHDIGMPEWTVIDSKKLLNPNQLLNGFQNLERNKGVISNIYKTLDEYIAESYKAKDIVFS